MGHRHLDVGPGTGYFIEKADPPRDTEITLLDPNQTVLRHVAKRLEERHPITVEADVMKPLPVDGPFDSAALSFVLHCLRGPEGNKAVAVRNIADVLSPEGVLFGGTVLGLQSNHTKPARAFLRAANKQGGFDNVDDTAEGLRRILEMSFSAVDVDVLALSPIPSSICGAGAAVGAGVQEPGLEVTSRGCRRPIGCVAARPAEHGLVGLGSGHRREPGRQNRGRPASATWVRSDDE